MCTVLLPPGDNPIEINKYIISYHIKKRVKKQKLFKERINEWQWNIKCEGKKSAGKRVNKTDKERVRERESLWTNDWICDQMNVRQEVSDLG